MFKKSLLISLVLFVLVFTQMAAECFGDALAQIGWADAIFTGGMFKKKSYCERAAAIYKDIVTQYPSTDSAFEAQKKLTILHVATGKWVEAEAAYQKLLADFSGNGLLPEAVHAIAYRYHVCRKYEKAEELYQYIIDNWPDSYNAKWSQFAMATLDIALGNDQAAQTKIDKLLTDFSGTERMAETVCHIAYIHHRFKKYERAIQLYQHVIDNWSGSYYAMWSHMGIANSNIALGNDTAAQAKIDKLLTDFSSGAHSEHVPKAIRDVAYQYRKFEKYDKANQLYQYVIDKWPQNEYAMWSRMGLAQSHISAGNDVAAQAQIDALIANFSGNLMLPTTLYDMAKRYEMVRKYQEAKNMYQQIIQGYANSFEADKAQLDVPKIDAMLLTSSGDDAKVQAAIDKLLTDFSGHPELSEAVLSVAEPYYDEGLRKEAGGLTSEARSYFQKALAVHETVKNRVPGYVPTADTLCWTGVCYRALGDYQKSIECSQKVVDDWPGHEYAWRALFLVACNYEELKESGAISKSEAETKAKAAYEQLLEKYPDCPAASTAQQWLTEHSSK